MNRRSPLRAASSAVLAAALSAGTFAAHAQDPAAIGSYGDPALVGGGGASWAGPSQARPMPEADIDAAMDGASSVDEVETLLRQVRGQISGAAPSEGAAAENMAALRARYDAENLVRRNWDKLGPLTRDLYSSNYDRNDPNEPRSAQFPYTDGSQDESRLMGGTRDAQQAMQNLEDLLLPMLRDLKQGFDNGLQQRVNR